MALLRMTRGCLGLVVARKLFSSVLYRHDVSACGDWPL
jgi:hypothetical protein